MKEAYLLIGGNMGNREHYLAEARQRIEKQCGKIIRLSAVYETAAWGLENQEAFLNQVLLIDTSLTAVGLLTQILAIEEDLGRKRNEKYGPRTIDIDILLYATEIIHTTVLTVPHPQMQNRRFVLGPLAEIAANVMHPIFQKSIQQLLVECPDKLAVQKFR